METLAKKLITILNSEASNRELDSKIDSESKRIPFIHSFPKYCCEHASYLLAKIFSEHYGGDILVVKGTCCGEEHFWVEVDGSIFDITIGQFHKQPEHVMGKAIEDIPSLVAEHKIDINTAFDSWDQEHKNSWLDFIQRRLVG